MIICASCRLAKPAAFSLGKPVGPTCAKRMGLIEPKRASRSKFNLGRVPVLPGQMRLELEVVL
jgi:hypothetical protein